MIILFFVVSLSLSALAENINKDWFGVAVKGVDVVEYFKDKKVVKGSKDFVAEYDGAKWYFSSDENKAMFLKDPQSYMPQYGGYCAFAVSQNHTADTDPNAWKIVNNKLYLNYNSSVSERWNQNRDQFIQQADQNWPHLNK